MLEELELRDVGPIQNATITPARGMTAITGETGAGKSMLLSALRLISGDAPQTARIAPDATQAWAQGVFVIEPDSATAHTLEEAGITVEDDEVFLTRSVPRQGRSRAVVCGKTVPKSLLSTICSELITIHGQTDQLKIASPARQRAFVDQYANNQTIRDQYAASWQTYQETVRHMERLASQQAQSRQQADYLRESIARIDRVEPHTGELEELKQQRDRIEHYATLSQHIGHAVQALDGSAQTEGYEDDNALSLIQQAMDDLRTLAFDDSMQEYAQRLDSVHAEVADIAFSLANTLDTQQESADLDAINTRIHDLDDLTRRWGSTLEDVIAWRIQAQYDLEDLDDSPQKVAELKQLAQQQYEQAYALAQQLSQSRHKAARRLSKAVNKELAQLAMSGASLTIDVASKEGTDALDAHGADTIHFQFTPFPGSPALPLAQSASGGELSRLMLALELCATQDEVALDHDAPMTFIFDEVDAGIGGKTAVELGKRLARLAQHAQVIVVTHLPQVASWAQRQYVVSKSTSTRNVHTQVQEVSGQTRVNEIARMLAGSESDTSLEHARELLEESVL